MSEDAKTWKRNTIGLVTHAQKRKEQKRRGVEDALSLLLREQKLINFQAVAKAAHVSKAYLYSQPDLRERIDALRLQTIEQKLQERTARPAGRTDASRDLILLAKDRRIKELEAANRDLQQQLKGFLGKAYDQL
jgi:Family of unknown function (DUF6262)